MSEAEVARLRRAVMLVEQWVTIEDEPPLLWRGADLATRLQALAAERIVDAAARAVTAGDLPSEDYQRLRDVQMGNGIGWGPGEQDFLRRWHERRWPTPTPERAA